MIKAGDILLTGGNNPFSRILQLGLHGPYSHSIPMVSSTHGLNTGFFRRAKVENVTRYFRTHRVKILRHPDCNVKAFVAQAYRLEGCRYDSLSYLGFLRNKFVQVSKWFNCSEAALACCHSGCVMLGRGYKLISPQSFNEAAMSGSFDIVEE